MRRGRSKSYIAIVIAIAIAILLMIGYLSFTVVLLSTYCHLHVPNIHQKLYMTGRRIQPTDELWQAGNPTCVLTQGMETDQTTRFEPVLCKLQAAGIGCRIGNLFTGVLVYDDDFCFASTNSSCSVLYALVV